MKELIIVFALQIFVGVAKADCLEFGTRCVWPSGKLISNNSIIIINTSDSNYALAIGLKYKIYLQSTKTKSKILLSVTKVCRDGLNLMQIILIPSSELVEGQEYELVEINQLKKIHKFASYNGNNDASLKWLVSKKINTSLPIWQKQPTLIRKIFTPGGCGPELKVLFSFESPDEQNVIIKAIIKNKNTKKETTCFIKSNYGIFELGHHMCWGEFKFGDEESKDTEEYEVTFYLIDQGGNTSTPSNLITFTKPNEKSNW